MSPVNGRRLRRACQTISQLKSFDTSLRMSEPVASSIVSRADQADMHLSPHMKDRTMTMHEIPTLVFYGNTAPSARIPGSSAGILSPEASVRFQSRKRSRSKSGGPSAGGEYPCPKRSKDLWYQTEYRSPFQPMNQGLQARKSLHLMEWLL